MAYHTFASILVHYVFSTKNREPLITEEMQPTLWAYIGGIARTNNMKAPAIGGMPDHVHLLLSLHPNVAVDKAVQLISPALRGGCTIKANTVSHGRLDTARSRLARHK